MGKLALCGHKIKNPVSTAQRKGRKISSNGSKEFYRWLIFTEDVDLNEKLAEWERFHCLDHPQGAFKGKKSYEALRNVLE